MEIEVLLSAAIQSSFLLGLIHGVNPCGHSWLVLAPFVVTEKRGGAIALLTSAFLAGTGLACLVLGVSLGSISSLIPTSAGIWVEGGTSAILLGIGILLVYNPHIIHHHDHDHEHDHKHFDQAHEQHHCQQTEHTDCSSGWSGKLRQLVRDKKSLPYALFGIGFVNMIIPCPTAAVMYGYALNSGNAWTATLVFGTYAISTAIAVAAVIYLIYRATSMAVSLQKDWVEPLIMRVAGLIIIVFSGYGLYHTLNG